MTPLGDRALTIDLPDTAASSRDRIRCLTRLLRDEQLECITGLVPAIRTLTVHYDPTLTDFETLAAHLTSAADALVITAEPKRQPVLIPVCYGGEFGPDLDVVANTHRTSPDEIVAAHTAGDYTVAMLGFLPGFPYLEGLAPALHTPRRAAPRTTVPAGSVGIGGASTGIYPCQSPGGWQLIGRTPRSLFSPARTPAALLQPGDHVQFVAITAEQWKAHTEDA